MSQEKIRLTVENASTGIRYRKMHKGKLWVSKVYPTDSRRNKSEGWAAFKAWRDGTTPEPQTDLAALAAELSKITPPEDQEKVSGQIAKIFAEAAKGYGDAIEANAPETAEAVTKEAETKFNAIRGKTIATGSLRASEVADRYLTRLKLKVEAGQASAGNYGKVRAALNLFTNWYGPHRSLAELNEDDVMAYSDHLLGLIGKTSASTLNSYQIHWRTFIRRVAQDYKAITKPDNLSEHTISPDEVDVEIFTVEECKKILAMATPRVELQLLLMLNCGMTQQDLSDLNVKEVSFSEGRIIRRRSKASKSKKTKKSKTLKLNWRLWDRTAELLRDQALRDHPQGLVFVKIDGKYKGEPLVVGGIKENGKPWRRDAVRSNWRHLAQRVKTKKTLKQFRKTGSTLIESGPHAEFVDMFLDHTRIAVKHYLKGQIVPKFDEAVKWLGEQFGLRTSR